MFEKVYDRMDMFIREILSFCIGAILTEVLLSHEFKEKEQSKVIYATNVVQVDRIVYATNTVREIPQQPIVYADRMPNSYSTNSFNYLTNFPKAWEATLNKETK